jgi:hypothetical protein
MSAHNEHLWLDAFKLGKIRGILIEKLKKFGTPHPPPRGYEDSGMASIMVGRII